MHFLRLLSMTPSDVDNAIKHNIPALISISSVGYISWMPYVISGITVLAIISSFFGVYIGSLEGAVGLVNYTVKHLFKCEQFKSTLHVNRLIQLVLLLVFWITASFNFSVIAIIQTVVAPVLALLLFVMPICGKYMLNEFKQYRHLPLDIFTFIFGLIVISGFIATFFVA